MFRSRFTYCGGTPVGTAFLNRRTGALQVSVFQNYLKIIPNTGVYRYCDLPDILT